MPYAGGVLYKEALSACVLYFSMVGVPGKVSSVIKSSLIITITTPAGPIFFCTPANNMPYLFTSTGSDKIQEDTSDTRVFPLVLGRSLNLVPYIVLFSHMYT